MSQKVQQKRNLGWKPQDDRGRGCSSETCKKIVQEVLKVGKTWNGVKTLVVNPEKDENDL